MLFKEEYLVSVRLNADQGHGGYGWDSAAFYRDVDHQSQSHYIRTPT